MPTHARTQIRKKVATLLTSNTSAGSNVFESRVQPIDDSKMPALLIYTKQETVNDQTISYPRTQQRQVILTIEAYVKVKGKVDDETDKLAMEIEQIIGSDPTLEGLVKDTVLDTTETVVSSNEGEKPIAVAVLNYSVSYTVKEHEPHIIV